MFGETFSEDRKTYWLLRIITFISIGAPMQKLYHKKSKIELNKQKKYLQKFEINLLKICFL